MSPDPQPSDREEPGDLSDIEPGIDPAGDSHVRSILAQHADPGPMPADIAVRLSAALAAATADVQPGQAPSVAPVGARPLRHRRRLAGVPGGLLAVAATGVVLLGGVGIGLRQLDSVSDQEVSSTAGAAQSGAGQPGAGQPEADAVDEEAAVSAAAPDGQFMITASGRDYDAVSLPAAAAALLVSSPDLAVATREPSDRTVLPSPPLAAPLPASIDRLRDAVALDVCARALAGEGSDRVLAADLARYQGRPAAVIVLPGPTAGEAEVWVVGPGCAPGNEQVLAHQRIPRP